MLEGVASFTVGQTLPVLSVQLGREGNRPWGLEAGDTVAFSMRSAFDATPIINRATAYIADLASDTVAYQWAAPDVAQSGSFRGWFIITRNGVPEESPEFDIVGLEHAPGVGARLGAVARAARREIPVAWDSLAGYDQYGDVELQEKVEAVKLFVLGTTANVPVDQELTLDRRVIDYLGKCVAIEVIPAAIDFWTNQIVSRTARGSDEVETYPNRIAALRDKLTYLLGAVDRLKLKIEDILGHEVERLPLAPGVDTMGPMMTPSLASFPHVGGGYATDPTVERLEAANRRWNGYGGILP